MMHYATTGERPPDPAFVEVRDRLFMPGQFELTVWLPEDGTKPSTTAALEFLIGADKDIALVAVLSLDADIDRTMDRLRKHQPIPWWKHKAIMQYADQTSRAILTAVGEASPQDVPAFKAAGLAAMERLRSVPTTRRRNRIDDERLREVADVYMTAESRPTATVAERLHISPSTAAHLVGRARKEGKIPPAVRGKPDPRK